MNKQSLKSKLQEIGQVSCNELGYELVEVTLNKKNSPQVIDFIIYHENGVKIDDCAKISRKISDSLDDLELINDAYELQVSSPGLDRPIKTIDDLRRNKGKELEANLYTLMNGKKHFEGVLVDFDEESISLEEDNGSVISIPQKSLSLLRQLIKF